MKKTGTNAINGGNYCKIKMKSLLLWTHEGNIVMKSPLLYRAEVGDNRIVVVNVYGRGD